MEKYLPSPQIFSPLLSLLILITSKFSTLLLSLSSFPLLSLLSLSFSPLFAFSPRGRRCWRVREEGWRRRQAGSGRRADPSPSNLGNGRPMGGSVIPTSGMVTAAGSGGGNQAACARIRRPRPRGQRQRVDPPPPPRERRRCMDPPPPTSGAVGDDDSDGGLGFWIFFSPNLFSHMVGIYGRKDFRIRLRWPHRKLQILQTFWCKRATHLHTKIRSSRMEKRLL